MADPNRKRQMRGDALAAIRKVDKQEQQEWAKAQKKEGTA